MHLVLMIGEIINLGSGAHVLGRGQCGHLLKMYILVFLENLSTPTSKGDMLNAWVHVHEALYLNCIYHDPSGSGLKYK